MCIWPLLQYGCEKVLSINLVLFSSSCEEEEGLYCSSTDLESGMGHLLFTQHLSRAAPVQSHRLRGEMCALLSRSCPLLLFLSSLLGFSPPASSLRAYLPCASFPPVVPIPDPVGCTLGHSFGLCIPALRQTSLHRSQLCCQGARGLCFPVVLQRMDLQAGISVETEIFP